MAEKKEYKTMADLTDKSRAALAFLKANDNGEEGYLGADIATAIGASTQGIHGVMNVLVKVGLVAKGSKEGEFVAKNGTKGVKPYTTYNLTEAGREFPEA